jgi:uracil-DNA glycosylase
MDSKSSSLLKKALENQIDLGYEEIVIDKKNVATLCIEIKANNQNNPQSQYRSLTQHEQAICECQKCPLGATRTNFVYGVGNPNADVMFVGEAPGRDEDLKGEPFIGRAGQLLDKILTAINFSRDQIYIANILKCRPPNNRDPQPDEMDMCTPYLLEQIDLIKPKIICSLGRIAAQNLLKTKTPLGKLRGMWHDYYGVPFMVTYHPAALLRFQSYKKDTWADVKMLRARYDEMMQNG